MVTVFKNFTTITITLGDRIFFDNPISLPIAGSLGVMVRADPRWLRVDQTLTCTRMRAHTPGPR
jgi:hypothetical protein